MVYLNWTIEVILYLVGTGLMGIAFSILFYRFMKRRERHVLYIMLAYLLGIGFLLQEGLSYLFLYMPFLAFAPLWGFAAGYALLLGIDSISSESVDPAKIAIWTGLIATVVYFFFQPGSFATHTFPNGDKSLMTAGVYQYVVNIYEFYPSILYIYYAAKINRMAPRKVKIHSRLFLAGAIITTLWPSLLAVTRVSEIIPGIHMLGIGIGSVFTSIAFARQPKIAFILPFQAQRLIAIDTRNGSPLFAHDWVGEGTFADLALLSGTLQGVGKLLSESIRQGDVREIRFARAVLLLHRSAKFPVACVLVASRTSPSLRRALNGFAGAFYAKFAPKFTRPTSPNSFQAAESIVTEWFAFVPSH
ncbi:MAG TPA: hypothetical protein VKK79_04310 [Candidatus Lokiarchaeia archaeon]|nr:hypothetical protein [Candidatus Lokiarchaeia archaeon]